MKNFIYLISILCSFNSFSQDVGISGMVKDATTLLPIEGISVSVDNKNIGTITNAEGKFRIYVNTNDKVLNFSHINFNSSTVAIQRNKTDIEILLEPKYYTLQEVVVRNRPVNDIVLDVLNNSKKQFEKSILLKTYCREFVKVNNTYTNFADGLLEFNVKRKSGAADVYVKQSRAYALQDSLSQAQQKTMKDFYFYDVRDAISDAYNFRKLKHILQSNNYDYIIQTKTDTSGNSIEEVTIIPKEGVERALYYGHVVYDTKTSLILEIDLKKASEYKKFNQEINIRILDFKFTVNDEVRKSTFKIVGDNYILVYNQNKFNVNFSRKNNPDAVYELMSDIIVTEYKEGVFDFDRSKRHKERSLFSAGNNFTEEYWKTNNSILLTDEEENVIKTLR